MRIHSLVIILMILVFGGVFSSFYGDLDAITGDHKGVVLAENVFTVSGDANYYQVTTQNDNIDPDTFRSWYMFDGERTDLDYTNYDYENGYFEYMLDDAILHLDGTYDSDSGVFVDQSGNGNHGTPYNGATTGTGIVGDGMSFDGTDDYIGCGNDASLNITDAITISCWCQRDSDSYGTYERLVSKNYTAYALTFWNTNQIELNNGNLGNTHLRSVSTIVDELWHHLSITYDSSSGNWYVYIDGTLDNNGTTSGTLSINTDGLSIGSLYEGTATQAYEKYLDEIRIYNRALTANEVTALCNLEPLNPELPAGSEIYCSYEYNDTFSPIGSDLFKISTVLIITVVFIGLIIRKIN